MVERGVHEGRAKGQRRTEGAHSLAAAAAAAAAAAPLLLLLLLLLCTRQIVLVYALFMW